MRIDWVDGRCVLCLRSDSPSVEHLIPEAIGGRLIVGDFLCKPCNDDLGARVEAGARSDPSIRLAVENLQNELPGSLIEALIARLDFAAEGEGGPVVLTIGPEGPRLKPKHDPTGEPTHLPTPQARALLEAHSERAGASRAEINDALARFDIAQEGDLIQFPGDIAAMKHEIGQLRPTLNADPVSDLLPLKAAYEFVALAVGDAVFTPELEPVREALRGRGDEPSGIAVEHLRGAYAPVHQLRLWTAEDSHIVVDVVLFGWLVYRVHFFTVGLNEVAFGYELDLAESRDYLVVP